MSYDYSRLTHPSIQTLTPYVPGKSITSLQRELGLQRVIKLASNENPLGASAQALEAARNALTESYLYPESSGHELTQALSQFVNVTPSQITLGNGSDSIFSLIAQAYANPGDDIIMFQYGFAMYAIIAHTVQANPLMIPMTNWQYDVAALLDKITERTKIIFIANPNNPTGSWLKDDELEYLLANIPETVLCVLDEAYYEFMDDVAYPNSLQALQRYPNLIITRTFSKAYGLAGLRVGYSISHPDIAATLNRARLPFAVNSIGLAAAQAALADQAHLKQTLKITAQGLKQLTAALDQLNLKYIPIAGNFVTIEIGDNALKVYETLLQQGIIIRPLTNYDLPHMLRVSVGLPEQNTAFINALTSIINQ